MNFRWRGERPAFLPAFVDNFGDLIGQLLVNPAISFGFKFTLSNGSGSAMRACAVGNGKSSGQIRDLVDQLAMRRSHIEGLDQFQTRSAGWRFVDLISFQAAAICCDDE